MTAFTEANFMDLIVSAEGTPYLYGGINPFNGGADCSGLIYWAGQMCGVTLPRTTEAEWAALPHSTNWQAAPYASIVEFEVPSDGGSPPQHVGVDLGNGYMIDDPHTGAVVRQETIPNNSSIWPIGYCLLPFVAGPPPPPPKEQELEEMDAVVLSDGTIVSHAVGTNNHYYEITRKAGQQGQPPSGQNFSIIDLTATWGFLQVAP